MSTKTLRKRIALVAVSAMGFGLLTSVAANAAAFVANDVNITSTSKLEVCNVDAAQEEAYAPLSSAGITIAPDGAADAETGYISVSGTGIVSSVTPGADGDVTAESQTGVLLTAIDASATVITIKPTAIGDITVTTSATSTSGGLDSLVIHVVAACGGDSYSAANSYAAIISNAQSKDNTAQATNVDTADKNVVVNAGAGYVGIALNDEYGNDIATTGAMVATVTSGDAYVALVAEPNGTDTAKGTAKTAVLATVGAKVVATVSQSVTDKPTSATVQITFNGTVVTTKTFIFQGVAKTIEIKDVTVGAVGGVGHFRARVLDANGNALASKTVANDAVYNASSTIAAISSGITDEPDTAADGGWSTLADGDFGCSTSGKTTVGVKHVISVTSSITKTFEVNCGGVLDTWTISMDKASYQPGEIATLTVKGLDAKGFAVNSDATMTDLAQSFGGLTAVTAPLAADLFDSGVGIKTYKFSVGTTEGAYVGTWAITGATDTAAKTVQYKVASASASVTNAEVLAAIVKLIASINKQIAALQKALKKK